MILLIIERLKRAEVQIAQGEQETSYVMLKKLRWLKAYYFIFVAITLLLEVPLLIDNFYNIRIWSPFDFAPQIYD